MRHPPAERLPVGDMDKRFSSNFNAPAAHKGKFFPE